jgi:magnesium-transporting ATPase (P-type)
MQTNEIIAQIIGIVLICITLLTPQAKSKAGMLVIILLANLLSCALFYFVDAKAGLFGIIVTTVRVFIYWIYATKEQRAPIFVFTVFVLLQISATVIGWENWVSALTLVLILNNYGQWQTNEKTLRICLLISAIFWGMYCFYVHAYTAALNKWLQAISTLLALYRFRNSCKEQKIFHFPP